MNSKTAALALILTVISLFFGDNIYLQLTGRSIFTVFRATPQPRESPNLTPAADAPEPQTFAPSPQSPIQILKPLLLKGHRTIPEFGAERLSLKETEVIIGTADRFQDNLDRMNPEFTIFVIRGPLEEDLSIWWGGWDIWENANEAHIKSELQKKVEEVRQNHSQDFTQRGYRVLDCRGGVTNCQIIEALFAIQSTVMPDSLTDVSRCGGLRAETRTVSPGTFITGDIVIDGIREHDWREKEGTVAFFEKESTVYAQWETGCYQGSLASLPTIIQQQFETGCTTGCMKVRSVIVRSDGRHEVLCYYPDGSTANLQGNGDDTYCPDSEQSPCRVLTTQGFQPVQAIQECAVFIDRPEGSSSYTYNAIAVDDELERVEVVCPGSVQDVTSAFEKFRPQDALLYHWRGTISGIGSGCTVRFTIRDILGDKIGLLIKASP